MTDSSGVGAFMTKTPVLWQFLGIYFNQDWPEAYGTEEAAVAAFIRESGDDVDALASELDWILASYPSEVELEKYLDDQGNEYLPPPDRGGYRGWLMRISHRVRHPASPRSQDSMRPNASGSP
jgi:hypothetical protein